MNDWIIYQIFVDAFARGSSGKSPGRRRGGDLEGVLEKLDYVKSLGADAIWLTPIFESPSDHGYNITDYFRVDRRLVPDSRDGAAEALFRTLVVRAHQRGLRVMLDLPLNHVGHEYDLENAVGEFRPRVRHPRTRQERGWVRDLKYLDHEDAETRDFLFAVAKHWMIEYGIDGYRYDYVHGIGNAFWESLYRELSSVRSDFFVVGEHWDDMGSPEQNARDIGRRFDGETGRCFDTLFDFPFQAAVVDCIQTGTPDHLATILGMCDEAYPRPACAMLDNHDTARITDWASGDAECIAMAMRLLVSRPGPICVLYGTETGLRAGKQPKRNVDESSRIRMDWDAIDSDLSQTCRRILASRRQFVELLSGRVAHRAAIGPLFLEIRQVSDGTRFLVLLNSSQNAVDAGFDLSSILPGSHSAMALCGGDSLAIHDGVLASSISRFGGGFYRI